MRTLLLSLLIGLIAAGIDTLPMFIKKLDKMFILSAALLWFFSVVLMSILEIVSMGWLNGIIVVSFIFLPTLPLIIRCDKKAIPQVVISTIILGALTGFVTKLII